MSLLTVFAALVMLSASAFASDEKITPYIKGDVDADMSTALGDSYSKVGHALDMNIAIGASINEKVATELYLTVTSGSSLELPAGGTKGKYDPTFAFDGVAVMVSDLFGTLSLDIFDYVFSYGKPAYYWLKNHGLISSIYYPRGLQATFAPSEKLAVKVGFGVDDVVAGKDQMILNAQVTLMDMLNIYFVNASESASAMLAGFDLTVSDALKITAGTVLSSDAGDDLAYHGAIEGLIPFADKYSVAYAIMGGNDVASRKAVSTRFTETFLVYVEPGVSFNDYVAFGLPLEFHMNGGTLADEGKSIWAVPTFYFYPMADVQIWAWGQAVQDLAGGDADLYAGLEVIWKF